MTHFFGKILGSTLVVATFLLIALATSEDCCEFPPFLEGSIVNTSDSCEVTGLRLIFNSSRNVNDTVPANYYPELIPPGDTAFISADSLAYRKLIFVCSCPGDTAYFREIDMLQVPSGSNVFEPMEVGCD